MENDHEISLEAEQAYERLVGDLYNLRPVVGSEDPPARVVFGTQARERYKGYANELASRAGDPGNPQTLRETYPKLRAYLARLCLIVETCRELEAGGDHQVTAQDVDAAWKLVSYFEAVAKKVFHELASSDTSAKKCFRAFFVTKETRWLHDGHGGRIPSRPPLRAGHPGGYLEAAAQDRADHPADHRRGRIPGQRARAKGLTTRKNRRNRRSRRRGRRDRGRRSMRSVIEDLGERGVRVYLKDGRLRYAAPRSALTPEVLGILRENKPEIRAALDAEEREGLWRASAKRLYGLGGHEAVLAAYGGDLAADAAEAAWGLPMGEFRAFLGNRERAALASLGTPRKGHRETA
jgi:hypothetical protein